jgi:glycosyltransferase involved in cell wall biosynthesis
MGGEDSVSSCKSIIFVTLEPIARQMAGPAIRAFELGLTLSDEVDVTVFTPHRIPDDVIRELKERRNLPNNFQLRSGLSKSALYNLASQHDAIFIQANVLKPYPGLAALGKYLTVDLYDPYLFSILVQYQNSDVAANASYRLMHKVLEQHMVACDFSVCASERQRDYWLGRYCALGRINPDMYDFDPSMRKLIDCIPFGLQEGEPVRRGKGAKGNIQGIGENDKLLLWGGGIWDWFDPLTVIRAAARASESIPNLRLFFMGMKSPNPQVPLMPMALKAKELAKELNVLDRIVFFHEEWTPYEDRVNYLLDADIGVSAHFDLPETRFSFRTRLLDYFWARLPVITTGGDQLAELIESHNAGRALDYGDVDGWVRAISELLHDPKREEQCRQGARNLAENFVWSKAATPLRNFLREPHHLPEYKKVTMPSFVERAQAVYARGGKDLVVKRSKQIIEDWMK